MLEGNKVQTRACGMGMLQWMCGDPKKDKIMNQCIRYSITPKLGKDDRFLSNM